MAILLSGQPPYTVTNSQSFKYYTAEEFFGFPEELWNRTSEDAKDLLKRMLCPEEKRLSAEACLCHK